MKILIAEDDLVSRRMLQATLVKWGYEVRVACDGAEAWQALQEKDAPKLVILDWMMPGMDGVQICREIRKRSDEPYTYILLLTAKGQKEDIVEGMEAGADDYVTKPFDPHELKVRLRAGRRILDLQEELISARETLRIQATHDPLTGLWNRAEIFTILGRELSRARREGIAVGVVMADLDHFKRVNDNYGHMAGDAVLRQVVARMSASMRSYDTLGRYGGEEFLIVAPGCDRDCTRSLAERLRVEISKQPIDLPEGPIPLTLSLGVAASSDMREADVDALIRAADAALYRAKERGRNQVEMATTLDLAEKAPCPGKPLSGKPL